MTPRLSMSRRNSSACSAATGADWRTPAAEQTELFRRDMESLGVIPPDHYVAATEMIAQVSDAVRRLLDRGTAYRIEHDIYFDIDAVEEAAHGIRNLRDH